MNGKDRSYRFREAVGLFMRAEGVPVERKPEPPKRLSEYLANEREAGDLQGLSRWMLNTRTDATRDWSGALDEARRDADHDGKEFAVVIWSRPQRPLEQSYAVMSLQDLAAVVLATEQADASV
jgi:hypothetical protein